MIATTAATVGILVWIGLIALMIVWALSLANTASWADDQSEEEALSRRRVRREMRVIDGRCHHAHELGRPCPIVHDADDMWEVWHDPR